MFIGIGSGIAIAFWLCRSGVQHECLDIVAVGRSPPGSITTNQQRGDNAMATQVTEINKRTVQMGFIGLGLMGIRLTRRLRAAGWKVRAWNRSRGPADVLRREGVAIAASLAELVVD